VASAASIAGDQARDIDSIRIQNRTTFDWGASQLNVGLFGNFKSLYHPIFQVVDQESATRGAFARIDWTGQVAGLRADAGLYGAGVDAKQLSVRQVEGTNYGEYFDADGNVVDPFEVVWHFEYKGTPQQKAALMRIRVELIDEDDEAADEAAAAADDDDDESEGDGADDEGEGEGEK
jgi:hypothetical protein